MLLLIVTATLVHSMSGGAWRRMENQVPSNDCIAIRNRGIVYDTDDRQLYLFV